MVLRILNDRESEATIESFLQTASIAHSNEKQGKDWYQWKFWSCPDGHAVVAVAEEGEEVIGCVAFGPRNFNYNKQAIKAAFSFETFVSPNHRRKGIFKKLIALALEEARKRGIQLLINFPNEKSLPGFVKSNWKKLSIVEYWIKPMNKLKIVLHPNDLKKPFMANAPNEVANFQLGDYQLGTPADYYESTVTEEYLQWRFLSHPVCAYEIIDQEDVFAIVRMGKRGKLTEAQILLVKRKETFKNLKKLIASVYDKTKADLIGMPLSNTNPLRAHIKSSLFIKVPTKTNTTTMCLDEQLAIDENIIIKGIDFHTY